MKAQRFSSRAVPYSGFVKCRDNIQRRIPVANGDVSLAEDTRAKLISCIVEGLSDRVIVENGHVVSGSFSDGQKVNLPVTKWSGRKLVARRMRDVAENAYWSEGFQKRIAHVASLVSEDKIEEAVKNLTPFLEDMEEFTLLGRRRTQELIENALASNAIFNQQICEDVATLFHRTNMRVNRSKIVKEWKNIAKKAEHSVLAENVQILAESKNFESSYDKFLHLIFEAISNKAVAAEALATTLDVLRDKTPKIKESHDLSSKLNNLITRLKGDSVDDAAIYEAEDLIATIQEELTANETLSDFDQLPGDDGEMDMDLGGEGGEGAPVININSPLIQVGGSSSAGGGEEEELDLDLDDDGTDDLDLSGDEGGGEEDELGDLLGGEEEEKEGGDDLADLLGGLGESKKSRKALKESRPNHYEMKKKDDDDHASATDDRLETEMEESYDPYAFKAGSNSSPTLLNDYGAPVIESSTDLERAVNIMSRLVEEYEMDEKTVAENAEDLAKASLKSIGLKIPSGRMPAAINQVLNLFESEKPFPGAAAPFGSDDSDSDSDDDDDSDSDDSGKPWEDEGVAEDQYHGPRRHKMGLSRDSYDARTMKNESKGGQVKWIEEQEDALLGTYGNVNFIFDHGGDSDLPPSILSEDGAVEIPVPEHLYDSAYASAQLKDGDSSKFRQWLSGSLEQLRPISENEDRALKEAMATITTTPEGGISVEVSDDVDVGDAGGPEMGMDDEMGPDMGPEMGMDDEMGEVDDGDMMEPVDSLDMGGEEEDMDGEMEDEVPDFEQEDSMEGPEEEGEDSEESDEDDDEMPFEDKDVTDPQSSKYTKHVKDNKRDMPAHKMAKASDDKLDDMGPDLKQDDGSGTKPPTARKMSSK
jgi:hypothetical protein